MTVAGAIVAGVGAAFVLVAALGVARLPDTFARLHAATKASTLGLSLVMAGTVLLVPAIDVAVKAVIAIAFQFATAPVAAHVIGRAAYRAGARGDLFVDDIADDPTYRGS